MKIYQLHEYSGEYEDFRDRIIGSYLRKERVEEEKAKVEALEKDFREKSHKCACCPFLSEDFIDLNRLLSEHPNYCTESDFEDGEEYGIDCNNRYVHWAEATYQIKEVEVEE